MADHDPRNTATPVGGPGGERRVAPWWAETDAAGDDLFADFAPQKTFPAEDAGLVQKVDASIDASGWFDGEPVVVPIEGDGSPLGRHEATPDTEAGDRSGPAPIPLRPGRRHRPRHAERAPRAEEGARKPLLIIAIAVVLFLAIAGVALWAVRGSGGRRSGVPSVTQGASTLLIQKDGDAVTAMTLFVGDRKGGSVWLVPPGLGVAAPVGGGLASLAGAGGDPAKLTQMLSGAIGVRIDSWLVVDSGGLEALFAKSGPIHVNASEAIDTAGSAAGNTNVAISLPAGPHFLTPEQTVLYMNALTPRGDAERLNRHRDIWTSVLGNAHGDPNSFATTVASLPQRASSQDGAVAAAAVLADLARHAATVQVAVVPLADAGNGAFALTPETARRVGAVVPRSLLRGR